MTTSSTVPSSTAFIIHPNKFVADDLTEILHGFGIGPVHWMTEIPVVPLKTACFVIVQGSMETLHESAFFSDLAARRIPVVVLNGFSRVAPELPALVVLREPFRTEDVTNAITGLLESHAPTEPKGSNGVGFP